MTFNFMKLFILTLISLSQISISYGQDWQVRVRELEGRLANLEYRLSLVEKENLVGVTNKPWNCTLTVFGKTYMGKDKNRANALAATIKKCYDAGGTSVWCKASATECSNE